MTATASVASWSLQPTGEQERGGGGTHVLPLFVYCALELPEHTRSVKLSGLTDKVGSAGYKIPVSA